MSKFKGPAKWRSDGPTRTNTGSSIRGKISAPIPFPDDDEFPIRTPGAAIATPLGMEGNEKQLHMRASTAARPDSTAHLDTVAAADFVDPATAVTSTPMPTRSPPEAPTQRTDQPSGVRTSITSGPSGSNDGKPQRKKSSLRSVLRQLFGRKPKENVSSNARSDGLRAGQHRSDPTALNRSPKGTANSQKRSASLPINEFNRALRSHSTATEDFPLQTGSNDINRDSIQADGQTRPRRATTPSRLWTPNKTPGYVDWTGLSPRPASIHARGSRVISDSDADAAIGMAVTSGSHPNRRSRSHGELREAAPTQTITRRRSDEIRYWRQSYDPGFMSPMSSNKAETEEPILVDEPDNSREREPEEQPQPFNFGPLGEMAGMKITQAASLETRVLRLEARMREMEKTVSRMQHQGSAGPLVLQDPPKRGSNKDRSSSATRPRTDNSETSLPKQPRYRELQQHQSAPGSESHGSQKRSSSYGSSRPSTISTNISYHPSLENVSPPVTSAEQPPSSQNTARPLSTSTTIRGFPSSSPTISKDGTLTAEHYTALINMILAEQTARQQLEAVVQNLQQQLQAITSSSSAMYPTPDSDHTTNPLNTGGAEFSSFEQDDSSDDDGRYINEDFQTPNEERGHFGDDIFGEVKHNGGDIIKSAPRTLSLSQITLGKGAQPSLNF